MAKQIIEGKLSNIATEKRKTDEKYDRWEGDYFANFSKEENEMTLVSGIKFSDAKTIQDVENTNRDLSRKYITKGVERVYGKHFYINGQDFKGVLAPLQELRGYQFGDGRVTEDGVGIPEQIIGHIEGKDTEQIERQMSDSYKDVLNYLERNLKDGDKNWKYTNFNRVFETGFDSDIEETDDGETIFSEHNRYYDSDKVNNPEVIVDSHYDYKGTLVDKFADGFYGYRPLDSGDSLKGLLGKTNKLFSKKRESDARFKNLMADADFSSGEITDKTPFDSAVNEKYGYARGRNLLLKDPEGVMSNGYVDPYCRVWTFHKQYSRYQNAIRPFKDAKYSKIEDLQTSDLLKNVRADYSSRQNSNRLTSGGKYLADNTVLGDNGLVNIVPSNNDKTLKKCMFSIENLAWKGVFNEATKPYQKGENGGRIMWFPPYGLSFAENTQAQWNQHKILGRGEPIFTYTDTERSGQLSFMILVDHPSIINNIAKLDSTDILEQDTLRFFAGCSMFDGNEQVSDLKKTIKEQTVIKDGSFTGVDNARTLTFSIYFPNNYSGIDEKITRRTFGEINPTKWIEYLCAGRNAGIPQDTSKMIGYEMCGEAISVEGETENTIHHCGVKIKPWHECKSISEDGNVYRYLVDFDKNQPLKFTTNYSDAKTNEGESDFYLNSRKKDGKTCSFGAFALAALSGKTSSSAIVNYLNNKISNEDKIIANKIIEALSDGETKVTCVGIATNQDSENSEDLSVRRAEVVKSTIKQLWPNIKYIEHSSEVETVDKEENVNTLDAKSKRRVDVTIKFNSPKIEDAKNAIDETNATIISGVTMNRKTGDITIVNTTTYAQVSSTVTERESYENEWEYFMKLEKTDPLAFKNITQKFKFFNPAYHSISPEGFNARLTFLQQCVRQGHTISADEGGTAGNLAFGRMPICVLKIGDFFNSRIIIRNVNISYGDGATQWDLNPEGIGVQPMYAKVDMGITILGGQSLEGPVSRLQNAVSFDYYANTGVYDNRSTRLDEIHTDGERTWNTWAPGEGKVVTGNNTPPGRTTQTS